MNEIKYRQLTDGIKKKLSEKYPDNSDYLIDDIYDCHGWVSLIQPNDKIKIFQFDENFTELYAEVCQSPEMNKISKTMIFYGGHSFIKIDEIFIDLTLDSEGYSFDEVQAIDTLLSNHTEMYQLDDVEEIEKSKQQEKIWKFSKNTGDRGSDFMVNGIVVCSTRKYYDSFCSIKNGRPSNIRDTRKLAKSTRWDKSALKDLLGFVPNVRDYYPDLNYGGTGAAISFKEFKQTFLKISNQ